MATHKNLIHIALIMMFENGVNCLLRFFVSIKFFLGDAVYLVSLKNGGLSASNVPAIHLLNLIMPLYFLVSWLMVYGQASKNDGNYGVPIEIMQSYDDLVKAKQQLDEQVANQQKCPQLVRLVKRDSEESFLEASRIESIAFPADGRPTQTSMYSNLFAFDDEQNS